VIGDVYDTFDPDRMIEALRDAGFPHAARGRGYERFYWPGDENPRSPSLRVPTFTEDTEERRVMVAGLLAELRRAVGLGVLAQQVLRQADAGGEER
jgi:hypothetical protein